MSSSCVLQVTEDLSTIKIVQTIQTIKVFTGRDPKDASHIADVKHQIETIFHHNQEVVVSQHAAQKTIPVDTDLWEKMTDWDQLTPERQWETKEFLLMTFGVDDLLLAFDEYSLQNGYRPSSVQYRIFINNWRGNKTKRRSQSLDEMKKANETINGLKVEIIKLKAENHVKGATIIEMSTTINEMSTTINEQKQRFKINKASDRELRKELDDKNMNNKDLSDQLERLGEENHVQSMVIEEQKDSMAEKDRNNRDLSDQLKRLGEENHVQKMVIEEQKDSMAEKDRNSKDLSDQLERLGEENHVQRMVIEEQKDSMSEKDRNNKDLSDRLENLKQFCKVMIGVFVLLSLVLWAEGSINGEIPFYTLVALIATWFGMFGLPDLPVFYIA